MSFILQPMDGYYLPLAGGVLTGPLMLPAGALGTPSLMFTGAGAATGFYSTGANDISFAVNGSRRAFFSTSSFTSLGTIVGSGGLTVTNGNCGVVSASGAITWGTGGSADTYINRDAPARLALRNGTAQQSFGVYNTESGSLANYERLTLTGVAGTSVNLTAESLGTGSANLNIVATPKGTGKFNIASTFPLTVSGKGSYVQTGGMTFANLAAAATAGAGARSFITDGAANVYGVAAAGGGALKIPVYSDGANWIVG